MPEISMTITSQKSPASGCCTDLVVRSSVVPTVDDEAVVHESTASSNDIESNNAANESDELFGADMRDLKEALAEASEVKKVQAKMVAVQRQIAEKTNTIGSDGKAVVPPKQLLLYLVRMSSQLMASARPAANEVRAMLHRIKMDNMERGRRIASGGLKRMDLEHLHTSSTTTPTPHPAGGQPLILDSARLVKPPAYLEEMGSFTSMPKIKPAADANDNDVDYGGGEKIDLNTFLERCTAQLGSLPPPIPRKWKPLTSKKEDTFNLTDLQSEKIRVLQWNVLSQALGTGNDNFVKCPITALDWRTRRFRMVEEIARHDADVICLQEVDHFRFLRKSLATLGYVGHFTPKPDSPCLYLANNSGPDGCAIFYKKDKFDLVKLDSRVLEVWRVQSNQVVLSATLKSKASGQEVVFATTHLKARNGALMPTLRNEQGRDLLGFLVDQADGRPVVCSGDFNAEPEEPVYQTMTTSNDLRLTSTYRDPMTKKNPDYTTWKIREDGEHCQTLDYIFASPEAARGRMEVEAVLEMPTGEQIGEARLPSISYASDHFSLAADLRLFK